MLLNQVLYLNSMRPSTAKPNINIHQNEERPGTVNQQREPVASASNAHSKKSLRIPTAQNYNISQKHWNIVSEKMNAALPTEYAHL